MAKVKSWSTSVRNLQKHLSLSGIQREALIGALLGDGSLIPNVHGKNFRLQLIQSDKQKAYLDWKVKIFRNWCLSDPHRNAKTKSWRMKTVSHEFGE